MRFLALLVASVVMMAGGTVATAQQHSSTYVCPKCGKVHASGSSSTPSNTTPASYNTPVSYAESASNGASIQTSAGGVSNVLDMLNSQRSRQGIHSLRYDPELQSVAERRAQQMAARGLKNHPPGSFAPGRYEGVGWSSSYSPAGVSACFTSDRRMQSAGAAMATGRDGVYFAVVYR